jgi:hypothetical protein
MFASPILSDAPQFFTIISFSSIYILNGLVFWLILSVLVKIISKKEVCKQFMIHGSILHLELPTEVKYKSKSSLNGLLSAVFKISSQINW